MTKENIPYNFSSNPDINLHKYFKNLILEFQKMVESSKDTDVLQFEMEKVLNASKQMKWKMKKKEVYSKDEVEKIMKKLFNEFDRYISDLLYRPSDANNIYLLEILKKVQGLIEENQVN